jgi:phosphoadenosine phosphosulfate reductase
VTSSVDMAGASRALEGASALEILRWATEHAGRLTFATGFGPEGCVILDLAARHGLAFDVFTLDTGLLFPETIELWHQLEARYGLAIRAVTPAETVADQAVAVGPELWRRDPDRCCEHRKVAPLRRELARFDAWVTAIRRDQTPARATAQVVEADARFGLLKINPLVTWTHDDVWAHLYAHDVPHSPLHARGYPSIGCQPCTSAVVSGEDLRAGRWRGTGKAECGLHTKENA